MFEIEKSEITYVRERLRAPFGFKGGYISELWQTVCKVRTRGSCGIGLGVQSILWSDAGIFKAYSEPEGNRLMLSVSQFALTLLAGRRVADPVSLMDEIYPTVLRFARQATKLGAALRETFVRNALVPIDNALWQLYGRLHKTEDFFALVPAQYQAALDCRHDRLCNVPLIPYGMDKNGIEACLADGAFLLKLKIGNDSAGDKQAMLAWDKNRLNEVHSIASRFRSPYTHSGRILYYLDANGQYDRPDRMQDLLAYAQTIGALRDIILLEEPFPEDEKIDVSALPVRVAADESVHSAGDLDESIRLGFTAVALKPAAKTMSESLKILHAARARGMHCFCADLTVNPVLLEFNKNVAARIPSLPELKTGILESNGAQNYADWERLKSYHPMRDSTFADARNGIFHLDDTFYSVSGAMFRASGYYEDLFPL